MSIYWTQFGPNIFIHPLWLTSLFWGLLVATALAVIALKRRWVSERARKSLAMFLTGYLVAIGVLVAGYVLPCALEFARCVLDGESDLITYGHIRNETLQRTLTGSLAGVGFGVGPWGVRWMAKRVRGGAAEARGRGTEAVMA
ncbi:MAG TPA: hypothetical protein VFQ61_27865 [Polyangiaceae bacterium]|nr:hypothetical protein [Polyangiaceae bacterium]